MSELIDNSRMKKEALKHLILELHRGQAPDAVRAQLVRMMGSVPYGLVVEVEQELIAEGVLPMEEILRLCDVHSAALNGVIDPRAAEEPPPGHPVDVLRRENRALEQETSAIGRLLDDITAQPSVAAAGAFVKPLRERFEQLRQVDRHYRRKENLLFPYLEKRGVTGPSRVMWGKDDEVRALLKAAVEALEASSGDVGGLQAVASLVLRPAAAAVEEMIFKEEQILFPMCLDNLTEAEWSQIAAQSAEIGWCLIAEPPRWEGSLPAWEGAALLPPEPESAGIAGSDSGPGLAGAGSAAADAGPGAGLVRFPSGTLTLDQLLRVLNLLPFDLTFVDAEDRVRYFTQGPERIFDRNVAILGRRVQECHPPASVHIVQQVVDDFRTGRADRAPFWIELRGRFLHIEYLAVRDGEGRYLGTLEVSQDLTEKRALTGERRLLSYAEKEA